MVFKKKYTWQLAVVISALGLILDSNNSFGQVERSNGAKLHPEKGAISEVEKLQYIRQVLEQNGEPKMLQTSITRFKNNQGASVDLVGAVHIGNAKYYEVLNALFEDYDAVLYELVASEDQNVPQPGRASSNPISFLQSSAQKMLNLSSQLEGIDYTKSNFVHADLSPQQLQQKMAERGQTTFSLAMDAFSEVLNQQDNGPGTISENLAEEMTFNQMLETFNSPYKLRRMMAAQFANENLEIGLGKSLNQLLVSDRNEAAMKVLAAELDKGHKKIAIFYGAAHMPDFQERLERQMGFGVAGQSWVDAWDLRKTETDKPSSQLSPLMQLLDDLSR